MLSLDDCLFIVDVLESPLIANHFRRSVNDERMKIISATETKYSQRACAEWLRDWLARKLDGKGTGE